MPDADAPAVLGQPQPIRTVPDRAPRETYVLAVDLGTGGPKVALVSGKGRVVAHAFTAVPIELTTDGGAEQDPRLWWSAVSGAARRALADAAVDPDHVVGIGCTAQWSGTVAVGADGEAIGNAITWMDSRGAGAVRRAAGGPVSGYSGPKAVRWIRLSGGAPSLSGKDPVGHILFLRHERPAVYEATTVFLEPVDYLNLRLTGVARASYDSITMHWVTDNRRIDAVRYHRALLAAAGLDRAKLPDLVPTGSVVGGLSAQAADELGLVAGTPVVSGTGDLHSAAVGSGAVDDFAAHLYIGTSSWISCHVPYKKTSMGTNIASLPSGVPGRYLVADEHETGGACLTWLIEQVLDPDPAPGAVRVAPRVTPADCNDIAAGSPPGANGVLFTPWLNGERSPVDDHTIRGGFHNLSLSSTRADLVRAVFEGVAFNSRWLLGAVEKFVGRTLPSLAFVGGGANSALWAQLHADITGREILRVADPVLANVRGAGFLTLAALGRINLRDVAGMVEIDTVHQPDPAARQTYEEMSAEFVNLYHRTRGIHRRLNARRLGVEGAVPDDDDDSDDDSDGDPD